MDPPLVDMKRIIDHITQLKEDILLCKTTEIINTYLKHETDFAFLDYRYDLMHSQKLRERISPLAFVPSALPGQSSEISCPGPL